MGGRSIFHHWFDFAGLALISKSFSIQYLCQHFAHLQDKMDDIEDMIDEGSSTHDSRERESVVLPKPESVEHAMHSDQASSVPGTQRIWLKTYGCSHNVSDSEYMQGILASYGYRITSDRDQADLWLLNSCTVKDPSQAAFMHLVEKARAQNLPVVVAGCVPQGERGQIKGLEGVSIVGVQSVDRVVEVVEETLKGHTVRLLSKKTLPSLDLPKVRKNPMVEIIPLSTGCLGSCTYCKTRHARGKLGSYAPEVIVSRAKDVIASGEVKEIWLSSEDTGAYGLDLGSDLPTLLRMLIPVFPPHVMLRIGMTNPPFILAHLEAIAEFLRHPNVYAFLHVPVQSGSNHVLEGMHREYTVEEFERVADYLLAHVPELTLATDVICGFPNESESDFDETMTLCEKYRFHIMNISQFYPRPGTPAARLKRISTQVVKARSRRLTAFFETLTPYTYLLGETRQVWINTEISDDGLYTVGHTKNYTKVLVPRDDALRGTTVKVQVTQVSRFHVTACLVSEPLVIDHHHKIQAEAEAEPGPEEEHVSSIKSLLTKTGNVVWNQTKASIEQYQGEWMAMDKTQLQLAIVAGSATALGMLMWKRK